MHNANLSIAEEVEAAIAAGSTEKCAKTTGRLTTFFVSSAGNFSDAQIDLFGDVFERLINTIELRALAEVGARVALAELSAQLAPVPQAPAGVVRRLARNEDITIAGPVLIESSRLSNKDLVEIAQTRSEKHLLAIAARWWLHEMVTDALLARRFPSVSRRLVDNPGSRVSAAGFVTIVGQAAADPELAVATGIRSDLPPRLRAELLRNASETVQTRLLSRAPPYLFEEIRSAIVAVSAGVEREMAQPRDFASAKMLVAKLKKEGKLNEPALLELARQRKYEETITALAELSDASIEVVRPLMQSLRSDGILVPCKVAGLRWDTVNAILDCRYSTGVTAPDEMVKLKVQYTRLTVDDAYRTLKFWTVRSASAPPSVH
jgi:uncharacterized protein (DUF2336 family)